MTRPFRHRVDCLFCGESFEIDGNADVALKKFRRPFWTDQFRMYREGVEIEHEPAAIDAVMLVIAGGVTLLAVAATVAAVVADIGSR